MRWWYKYYETNPAAEFANNWKPRELETFLPEMEDGMAYWEWERENTFCYSVKKDFKKKIVARRDKELDNGKMCLWFCIFKNKKIKAQYYLQV